ncbi:MAG: universal stress protein [Armatimonadetes bacterium]|nr:universal stress protein [Armatimonadota bacterium]
MNNILAGIDFSDVSPAVIDRSAHLARALSCQLWLVHVAAPDPDFVGYSAGPQGVRDQVASALRQEHRELQAEADRLRETGVNTAALLLQGPTVDTLIDEAERLEAGWVVVGSHGRGALYHLLVGSVTDGLIRRARCPVVVVPVRRPD